MKFDFSCISLLSAIDVDILVARGDRRGSVSPTAIFRLILWSPSSSIKPPRVVNGAEQVAFSLNLLAVLTWFRRRRSHGEIECSIGYFGY